MPFFISISPFLKITVVEYRKFLGEEQKQNIVLQQLNWNKEKYVKKETFSDETVRLAMNCHSGFFVWRFDETEDSARAFVVPVFQILHPCFF